MDNATLLTIASPAASSPAGGDLTYATPVSIGVRCTVDEPSRAQLISVANKIADATAVMYVMKEELGTVTIVPRMRVTVEPDGSAGSTYDVIWVRDRVLDELSHFEAYLRAA